MIYYISLFLLFFLQPTQFIGSYEEGYRIFEEIKKGSSSHQAWDELLRKYVDSEGNVNYKSFKKDEAALDQYLSELSGMAPDDSDPREEKLVYYINLYNAATVKLILQNYPLNSIKEINGPWDKKWVQVGDKAISLGAIEHKILRKLNEPRIHFAINCASYSCPKLSNRAYTLDALEQQLEQASKEFINDEKRNRISSESAEVSEIFKWFKSDFTDNGTVSDYINQYSEVLIADGTKLKFIQYDWSLNETK